MEIYYQIRKIKLEGTNKQACVPSISFSLHVSLDMFKLTYFV